MMRKTVLFCITLLSLHFCLPSEAQVPIKLSTGICAGGTGVAGIPLQLKVTDYAALDLGFYLRTIHVDEFEERWFTGPSADAGIDVFLFNRSNSEKNKVTSHGIYFKAGYGLHKRGEEDLKRLEELTASAGWLMEINREAHPDRFFQLQLGPSIIQHSENFLNKRYPPGYQLQSSDRNMPMIYCRLTWFLNVIR
jgi:hypothetical protein